MKSRSMHTSLMMNYAILTLILGVISYFVYSDMYNERNDYLSRTLPMVEADQLVRDNWEDIPYEIIASFGGYIQVLDESHQVVFSRGNEDGNVPVRYTEQELLEKFYESSSPAYYSLAPLPAERGKDFHLLVVIPGGIIAKESMLVKTDNQRLAYFSRLLLKGLLVFLAAYLISLWLYSKVTARKITQPLLAISSRLRQMADGGRGERLHFKANRELTAIQHDFNRMADQLAKTEEEKRQLQEGRTRMFMDISHDLKTPITTIQGYAEVLFLGLEKDDEQRKKYARHIYGKARFMAALVEDLLELTKLESAAFAIQKANGDFSELCRIVASDLYDGFVQKNIHFEAVIPEEPICFAFHKPLMKRMLSNLLENALKYNFAGAHVWLRLEKHATDAQLIVEDDGPGFSPELLERIFDPFVRGDQARTSDGGSGLGLAIVKGAVEKHAGTITIRRQQSGACIIVKLPLLKL